MVNFIRFHIFSPRASALVALLLMIPAHIQADGGERLSVVVRESRLRSAPDHWSPVLGQLAYGDTLSKIASSGAWEKVLVDPGGSSAGKEGYVHASAVTVRAVVLRAGAAPANRDIDPANVVLAGKGFNADVEGLYREQERQLDYQSIDNWERAQIEPNHLRDFLRQGGLRQ